MSDLSDNLPRMTADNPEATSAPESPTTSVLDEGLNLEPQNEDFYVLDLWEVNQRKLEALVAAGEMLPDGITAEQVTAWRTEHGPGQVMTVTRAVRADASPVACPAATGVPADPGPGVSGRRSGHDYS